MTFQLKGHQSVSDHSIGWSDWLEGDAIETSEWILPEGVDEVDSGLNSSPVTIEGVEYPANTVATVWVGVLTAGRRYRFVNRVTTVAGRTEERSVYAFSVPL
jgi:hypothetical protein